MNSLILTTMTRVLTPLILAISIFVLLRGHNEPGGGFIGGLLGAIAFALIEKARGVAAARRAMRIDPMVLAGIGLGCCLAGGLWGAAEYGDFLRGVWPFYEAYGLPVGSILLFDVGVYLAVVGVVCAILFSLEEAGGEIDAEQED
ncbi:Na(+)/H(+) antiporter subunit B [soil metagenome]